MSKPIWPKIPPGFVRAVLAGHSSLGLAFAALIYLVCFSGSIAVFANEFHRWEDPAAARLTAITPAAAETALRDAVAKVPKAEHVYLSPPTADLPRLGVYIDPEKGEDLQFTADADGRLVKEAATPWTEFMTRLHINLHLPQTWGIFVVGLTGVALLSSLISGLLAHPRVFRDAFHFRWGGSKRLQEADLHNRIGVWALPFHVAISLTGALLGLTTIIVGVLALAVFKGDTEKAYALFLGPHPKDDPRAAPLPNVRAALETLEKTVPGWKPNFIGFEHPGEMGAGILIVAVRPDTLSRGDNFTFDREGRLTNQASFDTSTLGEKIINVLGAIHFGWFAGALVKWVYCLLGLGLTAVTSSGVAIWLARRRAKGRPAPRWERIWIATVWGQPVGFAVAALGAVTLNLPPLAVWAAVTVACWLAIAVLDPRQLSVWLRRVGGGVIVLVAAAHAARWMGADVDPVAWWTNGVLVLTGIGLAATTLVSSASRPAPQPAAA